MRPGLCAHRGCPDAREIMSVDVDVADGPADVGAVGLQRTAYFERAAKSAAVPRRGRCDEDHVDSTVDDGEAVDGGCPRRGRAR